MRQALDRSGRRPMASRRTRAWGSILAVVLLGFGIAVMRLSVHAQSQPDKTLQAPLAGTEELWLREGRPRPVAEFLRPTLDPKLPPYEPKRGAELAGTLVGGSSDTGPHLVQKWASAFQKYYPNMKVELRTPFAGRSAEGKLIAGEHDFALVSREWVPQNAVQYMKKYGHYPLALPACYSTYRGFGYLDAIAVIVHKDNPLEKMTLAEFDAIYSKTRHRGHPKPIMTWGDLGVTGEWASKPINKWGVKVWNGFEEFVRQRALNREPSRDFWTPENRGEWRDDLLIDEKVNLLAERVANDRYAIAYTGFGYLEPWIPVKVVALAEQDGRPYHKGAYEDVARGDYPLFRYLYFNVNKAPGRPLKPVLEEFIRFILSREGQQVVLEDGVFMPLRNAHLKRARAMVDIK